MDIYRFALYLGFTGLAAMALLGVSHIGGELNHGHGGVHHGAHGADGFNTHAGGHALGHGHAAHGGHELSHGHHHGHGHESNGMRGGALLALLSPRVMFAVMLGFGATGMLLKTPLPVEPWRLLASACGGMVFEKLLVSPVWNAWMGFGSKPARTLESAVAEEAQAVTNFDANGHGLISIELDGHVMQVLGRLTPRQREAGRRVYRGDVLFVEDVDCQRNSCVVSIIE